MEGKWQATGKASADKPAFDECEISVHWVGIQRLLMAEPSRSGQHSRLPSWYANASRDWQHTLQSGRSALVEEAYRRMEADAFNQPSAEVANMDLELVPIKRKA